MKTNDIREQFKSYFQKRDHEVVRSSSLIPTGDKTLLFTNAGMNQFKQVFLGNEQRSKTRAVTVQKCMRVSGKHNDLENVGRTARHHTFFEMLGNFSFGDYFKKDAIAYGWEFLTKDMGLDPDKLYATVYEKDNQARDLWKALGVLPEERILDFDDKDNFWSMGETGPCGPCSEIHYDMGEDFPGACEKPLAKKADAAHCGVGCECGRILEIWNLVFMQYNRETPGGKLEPLAKPCIDTGMGLERLAAISQGVMSNYDTDLFLPLRKHTEEISGKKYTESSETAVSMNVIGDHVRALTFLISDGIIPSNEGRGYVLKKIMRRAMKHGRYLGLERPFLYKLVSTVVDIMESEYPGLPSHIAPLCHIEEEKFADTLSVGMEILKTHFESLKKKNENTLSGKDAFKLYDTYGFPLDLAVDIAEDNGFTIDTKAFDTCMEEQKTLARKSWKGGSKLSVDKVYTDLLKAHKTIFSRHESLTVDPAEILAVLKNNAHCESLSKGEEGEVILDKTPFYAESGGQVGDCGDLICPATNTVARVVDCTMPVKELFVHHVKVHQGSLKVGDNVIAEVSPDERRDTQTNHTATHLLHAALREMVGEHVKQAGSMVAPDRLRFDFSHFKALSPETLLDIENRVNEMIRANEVLNTEEKPVDEAIASGAMALFGENYGDKVRVVSIPGFSVELCGGTHVRATGDIGLFKFTEERSVASGVRRVEAVTGRKALLKFQSSEGLIQSMSELLKVPPSELPERITQLQTRLNERDKELDRLKLSMASAGFSGGEEDSIEEIAGIKVMKRLIRGIDGPALRNLSDSLLRQLGSGVLVLGAQNEDKAILLVAVTKDISDKVHAGKVVKALAPLMGGTGGGKNTMAQAGSKHPEKLPEAMAQSAKAIGDVLE